MPNVSGGRTSFGGAGHGERMSAGRAAASGKGSASGGQRNNFPGYRGPAGTSNPDTSSAGVSAAPRNSGLISTGQTTSYGAPVLTNKYGIKVALPETATPGKPAQAWGSWKDQVDKYNQAAKDWNNNRFLNTAVNTLAPFGLMNVAPDLNHPNTYTGGTYHTGLNPAELAGGLLGGFAFPGGGIPAGKIAGSAYTALGGRPLMLGGPDVPKDWDPRGAQPADKNVPAGVSSGGSTGQPGPGQSVGDRTGQGVSQLERLAQLNASISGNPGAPQAIGPTPAAPTPTPNYQQIMASIKQVTPGYGVPLPAYQYRKATV